MDYFLSQNEVLISRLTGMSECCHQTSLWPMARRDLCCAPAACPTICVGRTHTASTTISTSMLRFATTADSMDRYLIRIDEMRQSLRILEQLIPMLEDTAGQEYWTGKRPYNIRVPKGDHYGHGENPKGELGFHLVSGRNAEPVSLSRSVTKFH